MINITKNAIKYFEYILHKKKKDNKIFLFIKNPGTIIAECGITYYDKNNNYNNIVKIKYKKIYVCLNKDDVIYFKNSKIDVIKNEFELQLILHAPNSKKKIKKKKKLKDQIINTLNKIINPQLQKHNGYVNFIDINKDKYVILEFKGSCNGCSMANFTLKEGIEKKLKKIFPEINGVLDYTNHKKGKHSFY
ncbi:NifU family protein [Candidatus Annandia pinicola]|uniref:NifU family protein n=1 Tax=Candidatus Annandia pinicola TaxID=1345117 RepID=UPI001D004778|nr:NifU family protein [Candidatus Annandia pinicola]UDG80259.1 Fe/S biogenesis protein NfuA [Candidatus Annandia pinicola]